MVKCKKARLEKTSLEFPEDSDSTAYGSRARESVPITQLKSSTLLTILLQLGIGLLVMLYCVPSFLATILVFSVFPDTMTIISLWIYMVVWALLSVVCVFQIRAGYRFYKRRPDTLFEARMINIAAMLLLGIDTIISAFEGSLLAYPDVAVYFAANVVLFALLSQQSIIDELESESRSQYGYTSYD